MSVSMSWLPSSSPLKFLYIPTRRNVDKVVRLKIYFLVITFKLVSAILDIMSISRHGSLYICSVDFLILFGLLLQ
ncbi:hypothetical protein V6Z11_D05G093100 [Gossypium hirsutum]